jgi:hypothetical protein
MPAIATISSNPTISQRFAGFEPAQRLRLAIGIALLVVVGIVGVVMGRQAEWRVLYANLADKDGGAIVAQLSTMNVPYKYAEGGGAILVPSDRVYDTRLRLASLGLPKGSVAGFEMMESNRFGMTQFQERLTFQRGLEGELTRSIQALSSASSRSPRRRCWSACTRAVRSIGRSWPASFTWWRPAFLNWCRRRSVCWTTPVNCCPRRPMVRMVAVSMRSNSNTCSNSNSCTAAGSWTSWSRWSDVGT